MNRRRRGVALLLVLWIMAILTLLMYAFLAEMQVEYALAGGYADTKKAEQLCWSAIDQACATVTNDVRAWHGLADPWADDEQKFFEVPLGEGAFTVFRPAYGDEEEVLWGLDDEASKINVNVAPRDVLLRLPRMTQEMADAIVDWRDQDSNPGPSGAENSYYQSRPVPYTCKNQPFETVEELLYVRGITEEILYGEDANLNGRLEENENDGDTSWPPDNRDGKLDPGLWPLVTVVSVDRNVTLQGQPRVNLNSAAPQQLQEAGFTAAEIQSINVTRATRGPFPSVAHLLGDPRNGLGAVLNRDRFKQMVDKVTVADGPTVPGLVNINTAPKQVLLALPGITAETALKIIGYRTPPGNDLSNMGWLLDVMEPAELLPFANSITFRSYQFRIHAVGRIGTPYDGTVRASETPERPGAFRRMVAVFDKLAPPAPRLVYWKDLTRLGMPYDPADGPYPD